jgi:hypothetical protein
MPPRCGARPLKAWRWVGLFTRDLLLCVVGARVGPVQVSWWAALDRTSGTFAARRRRGRGTADLGPGALRLVDGPLAVDVRLEEGAGIETVSPHGRAYVWTRKQGGVPASGRVTLAGRSHAIGGGCAVIDDSAGYHARRTAWRWSAGVGETVTGVPVAWNLVDGIHDAPEASERTVWIAGAPHHVGPASFAADLSRVRTAGGGDLRFRAEATIRHADSLGLVAVSYEQPLGLFSGTLPVAGRLLGGLGVMESHEARW